MIEVNVDRWVQHIVSGLLYIGIAVGLVWLWKNFEVHALVMLPAAFLYILGGVGYLNMAFGSRPSRKRRRRPRGNFRM